MKGLQYAHPLAGLLFWAMLPLWWTPLAWWLVYSPSPVLGAIGSLGLAVEGILVLALLPACLVIVMAPPALLFHRTRRWALLYGGAAAVFIPSFLGAISTSKGWSGGPRCSVLSERVSHSCFPSTHIRKSTAGRRQGSRISCRLT